MKFTGYIGTYDSFESFGIYQFVFDDNTGRLSEPSLFYKTKGGKCVAIADDKILFTKESSAKSGITLIDNKTNSLSELLTEKASPCFIAFHDNNIYTANYHDGVVMIYKVNGNNLQIIKRLSMGNEAGCHQVLLLHNLLFVPCLNLDCVNIYDAANDFSLTGKITFSAGTGPRHGVFTSDEKRLYLVSELSNELFYFKLQPDKSWQLMKQLPIWLKGTANASAAIRLSQDERFIYISTRGDNILSVFSISDNIPEQIQQVSCGGDHPRDFLLSPSGSYLLVVNRLSNNLLSMHIDKSSGLITAIIDSTTVHEGVGITLKQGGI
ncbi:beta-propeller fold lactonase family protein [Pectinatus haikarae]|uniref:6-phosphogluconolactonase (Cycloisomerase 2 family) n=1 Tax=Pectinatus haikarae TaxID=349096 RepID=A0ABT9Y5E3_9FIRM|nr:beta-propeller fold lactonase family protein [Pectinatus haikarae]MDQ0203048.1 6-phosphogluconolactonase (cycloisomerase 2 family) [Pectinatus haikarae]